MSRTIESSSSALCEAARADIPDARRNGASRRPLVLRVVAEGPRLVVHGPESPRRLDVEAFIADAYAKRFGACVRRFMPQLTALTDVAGRPVAAVGCRGAAGDRLFLEQYTAGPIEDVLRENLGVAVPRARIVEVGSLACRDGRAALAMVRLLIPFLIAGGYEWVVFTAADTVQNVFNRLDLEPRFLCRADRSLLQNPDDDWGTYYDHDPVVMAGRLRDGVHAAARAAGSAR